MFSSTETVCVWHHDYMMTMAVGKNVLHFIIETFKKFFLCLKMHHAMKVYSGLHMHAHIFLTLSDQAWY
jgi:hypothetical protein